MLTSGLRDVPRAAFHLRQRSRVGAGPWEERREVLDFSGSTPAVTVGLGAAWGGE
jgi:hypothetical protein